MVSTFTFGSQALTYNSIQRTNVHPNPKAGVDLSYYLYNAPSATVTPSRQTIAGPIAEINTMARMVVASGSPAYLDIRNTALSMPVNPNATYSFSGYIRGIGTTTSTVAQFVQWIASDGVTIVSTLSQTGIATTSGTWQRPAFDNQVPPAGSAYAVYILRVLSSSTFAVGNLLDATGFLVEV